MVALLPLALQRQIAVIREQEWYGDAIDGDGVAWALVVRIGVEVAGDGVVAYPSWDANLQGKLAHGVLVDTDGHLALPRVVRLLAQGHLFVADLQSSAVCQEQVHIDSR